MFVLNIHTHYTIYEDPLAYEIKYAIFLAHEGPDTGFGSTSSNPFKYPIICGALLNASITISSFEPLRFIFFNMSYQ